MTDRLWIKEYVMNTFNELFGYFPEDVEVLFFKKTLIIIKTGVFRELHQCISEETGYENLVSCFVKLLRTRKGEYYSKVEEVFGSAIREHYGDVDMEGDKVIDIFRF